MGRCSSPPLRRRLLLSAPAMSVTGARMLAAVVAVSWVTCSQNTTRQRSDDFPFPFGFSDGTGVVDDDLGCHCHNNTRDMETVCRCRGEGVTDIPSTLIPGVVRLSVLSASLEVVRRGTLQVYAASLRDLFLDSVKKLRWIEPGAFNNLPHLRTVYIKQAPILKNVPDGVFHGNIPSLRILRIIQSALEIIPNMEYLKTNSIISMIDFDSNRIKMLATGAVKVKAEIMNLDYNLIEEIHDWAFHGSQIARLSMKGNKKLRLIGDDAFTGLKNIRKLDLSETGLTKLPTKGLEELEVLKLVDTVSFKVFPSVYHFQNIKEAFLTYPYHCCAFRFPATHDPEEYARYQSFRDDMERRYCGLVTTPAYHDRQQPTGQVLLRQERGLSWSDGSRVGPGSSEWGDIEGTQHSVQDKHDYGLVVFTASAQDNSSQIWNGMMTDILGGGVPATPSSVHSSFSRISHSRDHGSDVKGTFHPTTVSLRPDLHLQAFCGNLAKNYRDVKCVPDPDAFNPCEDVMGNVGLRVAVWFVVVAAVLGNLAVMVVLMSTRFTMSVSKFLMCNLAFADFCMGFYLLIIAAMDVHTIGVYFNYAIDWQHGPGCKVAGFITVFASELSIFTLTVITLERWYAITYAIHLNKRLKLGMAAKIMVCGWLYAITMATLPLVGVSGYSKTSICLPMENKDSRDLAYLVTLLTINGLAFLLICACYGKMYLSIIQQQSRATTNDMTVAKRMAMLVFTDFACWAPIAFFGLTAVAGYPLINVTNSKILLVFFYPLNSCANPFLYAILTKQYRRDFFILLSRYGFCTKRAMRYKGTYSCNTTPRLPSGQINCRGSMYAHVSFENGKGHLPRDGYDDGTRSVSSTLDILVDNDTTYEVVRIGSERRKEERKLSIVGEDSQPSSEEERSSSPMHKGSPHPIKNSYTKLNFPNLEQTEILKRVLGEETAVTKDAIASDVPDFNHDAEMLLWPRTNSALPAENSGFLSSPSTPVDTKI